MPSLVWDFWYKMSATVLLVSSTQAHYYVPPLNSTWQIRLSDPPPASPPYPNVTLFDFDLFDTPRSTIQSVLSAGIEPICYFSAGSLEDWRPDAHLFRPGSDYSPRHPLPGWPGEFYLNTDSPNVRRIMLSRLNLAAQKGCRGVDPDNTDAYTAPQGTTGYPLTESTASDYVTSLITAAHRLNLGIGLKNTPQLLSHPAILSGISFAVNEQCVQYAECGPYRAVIETGKPVFNIEYPPHAGPGMSDAEKGNVCESPHRPRAFATVLKALELGPWFYECPRVRE